MVLWTENSKILKFKILPQPTIIKVFADQSEVSILPVGCLRMTCIPRGIYYTKTRLN